MIIAGYNPRKIKKSELDKLKNSIKEFGFVEPVVVNSNKERKNILIGGHQRILAAKMLGIKGVPVVFVDLDEDKEKALNIALNKIMGEWDETKLAVLLQEIEKDNKLLVKITGFEAAEINNLRMFLNKEFQRPAFEEVIDQFKVDRGKTEKNENWFYIEFYGDEKKYKKLVALLKPHMRGRSPHEIDGNFFYKLVTKGSKNGSN